MADGTLEHDMARRFFGYGRWDMPYWFIGPEQGKGPKEAADNTARANAWIKIGRPDLCDCKEFPDAIGEKSWHREPPAKPRLQPIWRPLILLLRTLPGKPAGRDDLRAYQRDQWGKVSGGETCVIELCGLAAKGFAMEMERERFREERVEIVRQKIREHKPTVIVMYGQSEKKYWEEIAGFELEQDQPRWGGSTLLVFATHPNTRGRRNSDWEQLGKRLRDIGAL
jgi:hypothetical protein